MSATLPPHEASQALERAAEALRRTGTLFHILAHARKSGIEDMLGTLDIIEIGIDISAEVAEATQDFADLYKEKSGGGK